MHSKVSNCSNRLHEGQQGDSQEDASRVNATPYYAIIVKKLTLLLWISKQAMVAVFYKKQSQEDWHYIPPQTVQAAIAVFQLSEDHWFQYLQVEIIV